MDNQNDDATSKSVDARKPVDQWLAFRKEAGLKSNISAFDRRRYVLMRWDWKDGYYYVGPFATAELVVAWARENDGYDSRWYPVFLDPSRPPPLEPPGAILPLLPDLTPQPWYALPWYALPDSWPRPPADAVGAFHVLMFDPPRVVGPFLCYKDAHTWADDYLRRTDDEAWWVAWLDDSTARPRLVTPEQGKGDPDEVFAVMGWPRNSW